MLKFLTLAKSKEVADKIEQDCFIKLNGEILDNVCSSFGPFTGQQLLLNLVKKTSEKDSWGEGKDVFDNIRAYTNKSEGLEEAVYCLAENVAKTMYNNASVNDSFDLDSNGWVLFNLKYVIENFGTEDDFEKFDSIIKRYLNPN